MSSSVGLEIMTKDGTFDRIFMKYKSETIDRVNLKSRKLFKIENPFLPEDTPLNRSELWFDPFKK